uniref:hypothetical protein n=1 Tax=Crenothrix polyspora TaxID=360316 RepID=UPI001178866D
MNIGGVNLLSLSPGNNPVEGGAGTKPLSENNTIPEDFSNALMGQIALIEVTGQFELPRQLQSMAMPKTIGNLHDSSNLLKHADGKEERAALLDKYLPLSYKKNETIDLNRDAGLEATLLALTDTLTAMMPGSKPDQATTPPSPLPLTDTLTA